MNDIAIDFVKERSLDVEKILNSKHPRKVVVAGPGTGKSYLFEQAIKKKKAEGKSNFLAITFIGKLGDSLADDLAGMANAMTLHGFARKFLLSIYPSSWIYYPDISNIIMQDLELNGSRTTSVLDPEYKKRTIYYRAFGDDDIIGYALKVLKKNSDRIPKYDLILVDEFQDFNETEAEFIDILATKNEVLVVGDDDQALYEFKGSSPKFIRNKFSTSNKDFEGHTLRFCSRCTQTIVTAFHDIVTAFGLNTKEKDRIQKEYLCYLPQKKEDNLLNPSIVLLSDVGPGQIPFKIESELSNILQNQKVKTVLVIGEGRSCKGMLSDVALKLKEMGFRNVHHGAQGSMFTFKKNLYEGYKILQKGKNDLLAWRLIVEEMDIPTKEKLIINHFKDPAGFIQNIPMAFKKEHEKNAVTLNTILRKSKSVRDYIAESSIEKLKKQLVIEKMSERELLMSQLIVENGHIPRPLANLDITVCNILGAKGLGADVVFLIGFDEKKLPMNDPVKNSEVYQMLVALTRAKKRIYLINTKNKKISRFMNYINKNGGAT
ncbi:MAG: AAA family ATPase [bacterium]|nr:AAA family ATPase [bacterium]